MRQQPMQARSLGAGATASSSSIVLSMIGDGSTMQLVTVPVNPGLAQLSPELASAAAIWQRYEFQSLRFFTRSAAPTTVAGNVGLAWLANPTDSPPATIAEFAALQDSSISNVWLTCSCNINRARMLPKKYLRNATLSINQDIKTYDTGSLLIAMFDVPAGAVVHLWMAYSVRFFDKQPPPSSSAGGADSTILYDNANTPVPQTDLEGIYTSNGLAPPDSTHNGVPLTQVDFASQGTADGLGDTPASESYNGAGDDVEGEAPLKLAVRTTTHQSEVVAQPLTGAPVSVFAASHNVPIKTATDNNFRWLAPGYGQKRGRYLELTGSSDLVIADGSGFIANNGSSGGQHGVATVTTSWTPTTVTQSSDATASDVVGGFMNALQVASSIGQTITSALGGLAAQENAKPPYYALLDSVAHISMQATTSIFVDPVVPSIIENGSNAGILFDAFLKVVGFTFNRVGYHHVFVRTRSTGPSVGIAPSGGTGAGGVPPVSFSIKQDVAFYETALATDATIRSAHVVFNVGKNQLAQSASLADPFACAVTLGTDVKQLNLIVLTTPFPETAYTGSDFTL